MKVKYPYPKDKYPPVSSLPEPVRRVIKDIFAVTGCMDIYEGNAVMMLQVCRQVMLSDKAKLEKFRESLRKLFEEEENYG